MVAAPAAATASTPTNNEFLELLWSTCTTLSEDEAAALRSRDVAGCPVCLEAYKAGDELLCLPCDGKHAGHWACLQPWLEQAATCPCCRFELPTSNDDPTEVEQLVQKSVAAIEQVKRDGRQWQLPRMWSAESAPDEDKVTTKPACDLAADAKLTKHQSRQEAEEHSANSQGLAELSDKTSGSVHSSLATSEAVWLAAAEAEARAVDSVEESAAASAVARLPSRKRAGALRKLRTVAKVTGKVLGLPLELGRFVFEAMLQSEGYNSGPQRSLSGYHCVQ